MPKEEMFCYYDSMINTNMELQFITWLEKNTYFYEWMCRTVSVWTAVKCPQLQVHNLKFCSFKMYIFLPWSRWWLNSAAATNIWNIERFQLVQLLKQPELFSFELLEVFILGGGPHSSQPLWLEGLIMQDVLICHWLDTGGESLRLQRH